MARTQDLELFSGEREVDEFVVPFHNGKATLSCTVRERWTDCLVAFLRCGNTQKFRLKRVIGVSKRELRTLEDAVKVNLGLESLLGFAGEIKEQTTTEIGLEESSEEEQEFQFQAPPNGLLAILVYQMQRVYYLHYEDNGWGRRKHGFRLTVTEWLRRFFDDSKRHEQDPHCTGGLAVPQEPEGRALIDFGPYTLSVGYRETNRGLEVPTLDAFVGAGDVGKILSVPGTFERSIVPDYLLFLADDQREAIPGQFRIPIGEALTLPAQVTEKPIHVQRALAEE